MNVLEKRKLNLLVHLAKVDGRFEKSEQELLKSFIQEKGLSASSTNGEYPIKFSDFTHSNEKIELLYWALRMIQVDEVIHEKELSFCRSLALKLNFKPGVIDRFAHNPLPSFEEFEREVCRDWSTHL